MQECDAMSSKSYDFRATGAQRLPLARSSVRPLPALLIAFCVTVACLYGLRRTRAVPFHRPLVCPLRGLCLPRGLLRVHPATFVAPGGPVCFYAPPLCVYKRSCIKGFESAKGGGGFLPKSHRPQKRFIPRRPLRPVPGRIRHRDRQGVAVFPGTTPSIGSFPRRQNRGHRSPSPWSPPRSGTRAA